jgi:hypothetical protein
VSESFAASFSSRLPPASSAVWLIVDGASLLAIVDLLRSFGGTVLHTALTGARG